MSKICVWISDVFWKAQVSRELTTALDPSLLRGVSVRVALAGWGILTARLHGRQFSGAWAVHAVQWGFRGSGTSRSWLQP